MRRRRCLAIRRSALLGLLLCSSSLPVAAARFSVDDPTDAADARPGDGRCASAAGRCSLRAAVEEANALRGEDALALPAGDLALAALPVVTGPLRIEGAAEGTRLDAGGNAGLEVAEGASLVLRRLRIRGVSGAAAVLCRGSAACRLESVELVDNPAPVALACGRCELEDVLVRGNAGVGIAWQQEPVSLARSRIEDNGGVGLLGSRESRDLRLQESLVRGNGGGGIDTGGRVAIARSAIVDNRRAEGCGGGLRLEGGRTSGSSLVASTVSGNSAPEGGGLCLLWKGGNLNPFLGVLAATVTDNRAERGGGIRVVPDLQHVGPPGPGFELEASILAGNRAAQAPDCLAPSLRRSQEPSARSLGWNLIGDASGCGIAPAEGDLRGGPAAPLDPGLAPLAVVAGTPVHAPGDASPARERIPAGACATSPILAPAYRMAWVETLPETRLARTGLLAASDSRWLVFSGWFEFSRPIGAPEHLLSVGDGRTPEGWWLRVAREADGHLAIGVRDGQGRTILDARSEQRIASGQPHSLVFGFNSGINSLDAFLDDVELLFEKRPGSRGVIPYASRADATWRLFARHDGAGEGFVGRVGDVWLDDEFLSVDSGAHRYDFYDLNGRPLDLGEDGRVATKRGDRPPLLYLGHRMRAADWSRGENRGRGGPFERAGGFRDVVAPPDAPPANLDQRGAQRPRGTACEVGALELP